MHLSIQDIIDRDQFRCLFQPIINVESRSALGHEALTRGPDDTSLHSPIALFAAAHDAGLGAALDMRCFRAATRRKRELGLEGLLFLNLTPLGLLEIGRNVDWLQHTIESSRIDPNLLVIELTEQAILEDYQVIREMMRKIRQLGVSFAIDDLGAGYSGLRAWSELSPEFVKIDRYFVNGVDSDPLKMEFVRAIVDLARAARSRVIAEGVETAAEAAELTDAGIKLLQGFYLAHPSADPIVGLSETAVQRCPLVDIRDVSENKTARHLTYSKDWIPPDLTVEKVTKRFHADETLDALAVVEDGRPVGLVRRNMLLHMLSIPLRFELYSRKPIRQLTDTNPLMVDAELRLDQVSRFVTGGNRERMHEQFIVTENGQFLGIARMLDLLRSITQEQLLTARYSNPLTSLPGNLPIYDCISRNISHKIPFVVCHIDIDSFKPFNDYYGYSRGDDALLLVAEMLTHAISPRIDFLGHVGGDDFVVVFRSPDWERRIRSFFDDFEHGRNLLYEERELEQGGIVIRDRYAEERLFALMTVSVAALICDSVPQCSAEELVYYVAPIKARAKQIQGSSIESARYIAVCGDTQQTAALSA